MILEKFMEDKKILYSAVVLDEQSHELLVNRFVIPSDWKVYAHHMTISLSSLKGTILENRIGDKVTFTSHYYGIDDKAYAIKIDTDLRLLPGTPHITILVNQRMGGKPKDSNFLIFDKRISIPVTLTGTIQEIYE